MQSVWFYSILSVVIVSLLSFVGVLALGFRKDTLNKIVLYLVSFSAGALFGDAFIHLLPEIAEETGFGVMVSLSLLIGILFFFVIEKFIHWRHCHSSSKDHIHPFVFTNLIGDALHNFIDGLIISGSYLISIPVGIATTVAVILHEIPQEIGDFGVLIHGGLSRSKALFFNFLSAATAILGAVVALLLSRSIENINYFLIPFASGGFIYIAGADLIPELHKEVKVGRSGIQLIMFILGIGVMFALLLLE